MEYWIEQIRLEFTKNSYWSWIFMAVGSVGFTFIVKLILKIVSSRLRVLTQRTHSMWDDISVDILDGLKASVLFIWTFYLLTKSLEPSPSTQKLLQIAVVVASIFQIGLWGIYIIKNWKHSAIGRRLHSDPSSAAALGLLGTVIQLLFIVIIILIGLSNLGVNISALLAGLGVGGIAVALAAQNVLGDLLASLSIVLDKPFVVGEFIATGKELGTVDNIGIKTTRIRALSGEEVIISNKDLLESRIQNFARQKERRIVQSFGVEYATPAHVIESIGVWVKEIIQKQPQLRFDRCHFKGFGASSLDFEFVFIVQSADFNVYMDAQQKILLDIYRKFEEQNVAFAYPTQKLYIEGTLGSSKNDENKDEVAKLVTSPDSTGH